MPPSVSAWCHRLQLPLMSLILWQDSYGRWMSLVMVVQVGMPFPVMSLKPLPIMANLSHLARRNMNDCMKPFKLPKRYGAVGDEKRGNLIRPADNLPIPVISAQLICKATK